MLIFDTAIYRVGLATLFFLEKFKKSKLNIAIIEFNQ
jgi:hypothetical protein